MSDALFIFCFDTSLKASQSWNDSSTPAALLQDAPKLPLQFQSCIIQNKEALKRSTEKFSILHMLLQINAHSGRQVNLRTAELCQNHKRSFVC